MHFPILLSYPCQAFAQPTISPATNKASVHEWPPTILRRKRLQHLHSPLPLDHSSGAKTITSRCRSRPFGDVPGGVPATLPDPNVLTNGAWYGGSPDPRSGCQACARRWPHAYTTTNANLARPCCLRTFRPIPPTSAVGRLCGTRTTSGDHNQQRLPRRNDDDHAGGLAIRTRSRGAT